jgi:hypothetical protein
VKRQLCLLTSVNDLRYCGVIGALVIAMVTVTPATMRADLADGLVAYYSFDDGAGQV